MSLPRFPYGAVHPRRSGPPEADWGRLGRDEIVDDAKAWQTRAASMGDFEFSAPIQIAFCDWRRARSGPLALKPMLLPEAICHRLVTWVWAGSAPICEAMPGSCDDTGYVTPDDIAVWLEALSGAWQWGEEGLSDPTGDLAVDWNGVTCLGGHDTQGRDAAAFAFGAAA